MSNWELVAPSMGSFWKTPCRILAAMMHGDAQDPKKNCHRKAVAKHGCLSSMNMGSRCVIYYYWVSWNISIGHISILKHHLEMLMCPWNIMKRRYLGTLALLNISEIIEHTLTLTSGGGEGSSKGGDLGMSPNNVGRIVFFFLTK